ncbi:ABC transporter substrate-binding protein [Dongia sedimenti]|uniref:ABC transporter substrate-binding protein n=1 Tax=Dongia sedimenti TaxID=3064282 RepID=A0ABU0YKT3_9PROT|nr:ABC transporter substrate-binding protein [Rhodospirillaceae bacterium R-7]
MRIVRRGLLLAGIAASVLAMPTILTVPSTVALAASASQAAAPVGPVQRLDNALIETMQNAEQLKFQGRYDKLAPVLNAVFDVPEMTRIAVGPMWNDASEADKAEMTEVFGRYMATMYAARFNGYKGETFEIADSKPRDGGRVLVITKLVRKDQEPVELSYLMKGEGDNWHVTDVYYNGSISQLAQLRSEFSAPLRDGGVKNLKSVLETKIKQLQGGA